jgi:hypothetical protein
MKDTMKVASLSLLALSLLAHRVDSQQFVCNFCPENGIQNRIGVVVIPFEEDRTCTELETAANSFSISEGQCPGVMAFADPICCFAPAAPTTPPPITVSPTTESPPTEPPTGTPTSTPTDSIAPTTSSEPTGTPTAAPTFGPAPECYTDLDEILRRERAVFDSSVYREYILCPNTDFIIGRQVGRRKYEGGFEPISPRRNVGYKCGKEGLLSNNCKIIDGTFQLISFDVQFAAAQYEPHTNVTISGLHFEAGFFGTALLANRGSITFNDCAFKVSLSGVPQIPKRSVHQSS